MEELKYIVSKESQDWENISLDEIKNLDKQKLWETLSQLDDSVKNTLLIWLKNLIKNNLSQIQDLPWDNKNKESIIYALQIFWNLSWIQIKINGNYSKELDNPEFKKLFIETKEKQKTNLSEKLGLPIEKLKDAKNLWEFLNITLETLLKKYAIKLNSPEWISLKTWEIYKELVILVQEIDKNLPKWNIYKWNSDVIINNFLTPKENWEKLINAAINKVLNPNEKEMKAWKIDTLKIGLKWIMGTLIDLSKTKNPEELQLYIKEFKIKEIIEKLFEEKLKENPDLRVLLNEIDKVFDLVVSLAKTLDKKDKNELFSQIDNFFEKNTDNLLKIANKKSWEKVEDKVILEVTNWSWKIVDGVITVKRVDIALNELWKFEFLRDNPLISQAIDIINNSKLSSEDKYLLFKEISSLVLNATSPNLSKIQQSENIKKALNSIIDLLSKFNKEWKIDDKKVVKFIKELLKWWEETSILDKISKIKSFSEFKSLMADNYETIKILVMWTLKWRDALEDAIGEFIRNNKLSDNIEKASGNLIERLEKSFKLDISDMILSIRKALLEDNNTKKIEKKDEKNNEAQKAADDIWSVVVDMVSKRWSELLKSKLKSTDLNQKKLTKEDIINSVFSWIWDIFKDEELKNRLFINAKKLWAKVDNKELFIQNLVTNFLNNPEFKSVINNISSIFISRLANSNNVNLELDNIKNDINKLVWDFTKNYWKEWISWAVRTFNETKLIDEKTKSEILSTSFSIVYDYLKDPQNIDLLLKSFPEISKKLPAWLSEAKVSQILWDFIKSIPKNIFWQILAWELKNGFNIENFKKPENIMNLFNKILQSKDVNKDLILQTIIDTDLWKIGKSQKEWISETKTVNKDLIISWVDALYSLLWWASKEKINSLVESLWLNKIFSWSIETTLKNIPKETLKKNLISNIDFVNNAINWNVDMSKWLKFASELYKDIPVEKRLNVIDDLIWNISISKEWLWSSFKIDSSHSKYLVDIIYSTLETNDNAKLLNIISKISPALFTILSQKEYLGKDNLSIGIWIFTSISKEKFQSFLDRNSQNLNSLMTSRDKIMATKLAVELFWEVNVDNLKENLTKDNKITKNEKFWIDMASSIQKSLEKNKSKIDSVIKTWEKLKKHFDSWEKDISKSGLTQAELSNFSWSIFDIINDTLNMELKNIMEKQNLQNINEARVILAEMFDIPVSKWDSKIDMSKINVFDFFMNNPGFSMYWWWAYLFKWKDYMAKNAWLDYFMDQGKKNDFSKMFSWYFV